MGGRGIRWVFLVCLVVWKRGGLWLGGWDGEWELEGFARWVGILKRWMGGKRLDIVDGDGG